MRRLLIGASLLALLSGTARADDADAHMNNLRVYAHLTTLAVRAQKVCRDVEIDQKAVDAFRRIMGFDADDAIDLKIAIIYAGYYLQKADKDLLEIGTRKWCRVVVESLGPGSRANLLVRRGESM